MKNWIGPVQVLLSGTCFGFLGAFGKWAFASGLTVGELLTFRFSIASVILGLYLLLTSKKSLQLGSRNILTSLLLGFFGYAVFSTLYFESIRGISVGLAALLLFTFPLFVSVGSWFFLKRPLGIYQMMALVLSSTGLVLLVWGEWSVQNSWALVAALGAALTYAAYVLISGELQKNVPPLASSFYVMIGAAIGLALFHRPSVLLLQELTRLQWLILLGIGIICTIAPLSLFLAGLQKMPSAQAALLVTIEPVVATLAGTLLFSEQMSRIQWLGALCILTSLLVSHRQARLSESLS